MLGLASAASAGSPDGGAEKAVGLANIYGSDLGAGAVSAGRFADGGAWSVGRGGDHPVAGAIPKEVLRDIIRSHREEVVACADQAGTWNRAGRGAVKLRWKILPTGVVTQARVKDAAFSDPALERCLLEAVSRWTFPKPTGGAFVLVTYPFDFQGPATDAGASPTVAPGQCPATRAEVKAGSPCAPLKVEACPYPGGAWCACEGTSCVTAAGPMPGCVSTLRWVCRDDGCPRVPMGACATEGRQCSYDNGLCAAVAECRENAWTMGRANCRPSAPPSGGN